MRCMKESFQTKQRKSSMEEMFPIACRRSFNNALQDNNFQREKKDKNRSSWLLLREEENHLINKDRWQWFYGLCLTNLDTCGAQKNRLQTRNLHRQWRSLSIFYLNTLWPSRHIQKEEVWPIFISFNVAKRDNHQEQILPDWLDLWNETLVQRMKTRDDISHWRSFRHGEKAASATSSTDVIRVWGSSSVFREDEMMMIVYIRYRRASAFFYTWQNSNQSHLIVRQQHHFVVSRCVRCEDYFCCDMAQRHGEIISLSHSLSPFLSSSSSFSSRLASNQRPLVDRIDWLVQRFVCRSSSLMNRTNSNRHLWYSFSQPDRPTDRSSKSDWEKIIEPKWELSRSLSWLRSMPASLTLARSLDFCSHDAFSFQLITILLVKR